MDWWKKKKTKKERVLLCRERGAMLLEDLIKCCNGKTNPIKIFSADLILKATDNFSEYNRKSKNQYDRYEWFSGKNDDDRIIIIKKYEEKIDKYNADIYRDVVISSMVSGHKNFMKLVGCCLELEYPVMVYCGEKKQHCVTDLEMILSWKRRMKIAEDIATALAYLHTAFTTPFVYRNMSIDNILLDKDGVAKLCDFSYCISIPLGETFVEVNEIIGTLGYSDDEYMARGIVSEKTDAYGFGMCMILLIIGGSKRFCELAGNDWMDPRFVSEFIEEDRLVDEIVDPNMLEDMGEITEEERYRMSAFLLLSMRCVGLKGEVPTMVEVAKELKKIQRSSQNVFSS